MTESVPFDERIHTPDNNCCLGPLHCEGREFDSTKPDCQECRRDAEEAMKDE